MIGGHGNATRPCVRGVAPVGKFPSEKELGGCVATREAIACGRSHILELLMLSSRDNEQQGRLQEMKCKLRRHNHVYGTVTKFLAHGNDDLRRISVYKIYQGHTQFSTFVNLIFFCLKVL